MTGRRAEVLSTMITQFLKTFTCRLFFIVVIAKKQEITLQKKNPEDQFKQSNIAVFGI